jgi:hypothetical protein
LREEKIVVSKIKLGKDKLLQNCCTLLFFDFLKIFTNFKLYSYIKKQLGHFYSNSIATLIHNNGNLRK